MFILKYDFGPVKLPGLSRNVQEFLFDIPIQFFYKFKHIFTQFVWVSVVTCGPWNILMHVKPVLPVIGARAHVMKRTKLGEVVLYRLRVAFFHWGRLRADVTYLKRYGCKLAFAFASVRASTTIIFRVRGGIKAGLACNAYFRKYNSRAVSTSILFL